MSCLTGERCPVSLLYLPKRLLGYSRTWQDRCGGCPDSLSYLLSMPREDQDLLVPKVIYCLFFRRGACHYLCVCAKRGHSIFVVKKDRTSIERVCMRAPSYFHTCFGGRTRYGSLRTKNSFLCHIRYVESRRGVCLCPSQLSYIHSM